MGGLESVITGLMDEFNFHVGKYKIPRELFTVCVLCASFSMSMVNVTRVSLVCVTIIIIIIIAFRTTSKRSASGWIVFWSGRWIYGDVVWHLCRGNKSFMFGVVRSPRRLLGLRIGPFRRRYPSNARLQARNVLEMLLEIRITDFPRCTLRCFEREKTQMKITHQISPW